ncbi:MAG: hypothetical protein ISR55_06800 [Bacteroidetes bacterium]|nr:hypothetical protein [Bacteroidota bacterium]
MKKTIAILFLIAVSLNCVSQQVHSHHAFDEMLNKLDIDESNLGFTPKGYWSRYPNPNQILYAIPAFNDLMAEPQYIYDYVKTQAIAVNDFMHPDYLKSNRDALLKVSTFCGIMHQTSEFRAFGASLWAFPDKTNPLLHAVKQLYALSGYVFDYNRMEERGEFPLLEKDLKEAISALDPLIQTELARAVINLAEAYRFQQYGMRNVNYKDAVNCWRIRRLGETQFDGMEYYPQLENVVQNIDMNSIYYAGLKLVAIAEQFSDSIQEIMLGYKHIRWEDQNFEFNTPIGRIVVKGSKKDVHQYSDAMFVVDFGGNDRWLGCVGATPSLQIPISLVIDMEGNDEYVNNDENLPSQGAAIMGASVLLDVRGDDHYISKRLSQGAAMLGVGILADMEGDDHYDMWTSGQGAAYFGVGLAIDNSGNDSYKIWGDGQGYGGVGGVGSLINRSGNDSYFAEPDTAIVFRSDYYHSFKGQYNYSYVQGCGVGRRGDITDGHDWAGGMGTLIDLEGNDEYLAGGWAQGCGYWYGSGFLYDQGGNDTYQSTGWSQASGAHFCLGVLMDEGGNDLHSIWEKQAAGIAFGHDYTIAILLNKGGNDVYKIKDDGLGYAINKSQVFFLDTEGDDVYQTNGKGHNYGATNHERNNPPSISALYHLYSDQICLFADLTGDDTYLIKEYGSNKQEKDSRMGNNKEYFSPATGQKEKQFHKRNYGLGIDFVDWQSPAIDYFENKLKIHFKEFK